MNLSVALDFKLVLPGEIKEALPGPFNLAGQMDQFTELVEFTEGIHVFHGKRRSNLEDDLSIEPTIKFVTASLAP